jgi:hypothetical protein
MMKNRNMRRMVFDIPILPVDLKKTSWKIIRSAIVKYGDRRKFIRVFG